MSKTMLFSPGPVMVKDNVRQSLLHYDICHRSHEFDELFRDTQAKILKLFNADDSYYSLIVSGSGTAANETVLSSCFKAGEKALIIRNGEFGTRLKEMLEIYAVPTIDCEFAWAEYPDLAKIEEAVKANPEIKVIAMVFHETSTGMINPVYEVGQLCAKYGKWFYVDSVSAGGGQNIDVVKNNITFTSSVGGKCIGAFPGTSYICAKEEVLRQITPGMCKSYINLCKLYTYAKEKSQTPNTPNVNLFWALNTALTNVIEKETLEGTIARYRKCAKILRDGLREMGLRLLLEDKYMSNTVTSAFLPEGKNLDKFTADLEAAGYTIYKGKKILEEQGVFQVVNMGEIYPDDCVKLLEELKKALA